MRHRFRRILTRWGLAAAGAAGVLGLLVYLGLVNWQAGREQAAYSAQRRAAAVVQAAHDKGLPAPPPATGTAEQQTVHAYQQHVLTPPPGPGTMADVEADRIMLGFSFGGKDGKQEYVEQEMRLRDVSAHDVTSLIVPLLSRAYNVHLNVAESRALPVEDGSVTVPVSLSAKSGYSFVRILYQIPYNFLAPQSWSAPTFLLRGLWIGFLPSQSYLAVTGSDFHRDASLDPLEGGALVWTSGAPVRTGATLTWRIVPANPASYPNVESAPPAPRTCVSPTGQPLCKGSGG